MARAPTFFVIHENADQCLGYYTRMLPDLRKRAYSSHIHFFKFGDSYIKSYKNLAYI